MVAQLPLVFSLIALFISVGSIALLLLSRRALRRLSSVSDKESLDRILEDVIAHLRTSKKRQAEIDAALSVLQRDGETHICHMGLVRFNPFSDVGGEQSVAVAFLDGHYNGIVISSLRGRQETRFFAKPVRSGKEEKYPFSNEEKIAIQRAIHP